MGVGCSSQPALPAPTRPLLLLGPPLRRASWCSGLGGGGGPAHCTAGLQLPPTRGGVARARLCSQRLCSGGCCAQPGGWLCPAGTAGWATGTWKAVSSGSADGTGLSQQLRLVRAWSPRSGSGQPRRPSVGRSEWGPGQASWGSSGGTGLGSPSKSCGNKLLAVSPDPPFGSRCVNELTEK